MRRHSIVRHQPNYFYVPLEDDYLAIYDQLANELDPLKESQGKPRSASSDCKAMITAVLEGWMNSKRTNAKGESDLYVYLSIDQWVQQLRGRYKRSVIIQCLKEMAEEGTAIDPKTKEETRGTIKKVPHIQNMFGYCLNLPVVQELLDALPEESPYDMKTRPTLGRPKKSSPKKDGLKINGLKKDGITEKQSKNGPINGKSSPKKDGSFYITQNSNYTEFESTERESIPSSVPSSQSLEDEKPTEITLTEEGQQVYDFACQELFKAKPPEVTTKLKEECEELAKHVKTLEQFQSLLRFVQALSYIKGKIHLKNLVNELNGWLQTRPSATPATKPRSADDPVAKYRAIMKQFMPQEVH